MAGFSTVQDVLVDISEDNDRSEDFGVGGADAGSVQMPAAMDGAILNYEVSNDGGTTWSEVRGTVGAALANQAAAADKVNPIPAEVFGSQLCRLVVAAQSADRTFKVALSGP